MRTENQALSLTVNPIAKNELWEMRNALNEFVHSNFDALYEGAVRLNKHIPAEFYCASKHAQVAPKRVQTAPKRVQIAETRLHRGIGLKHAAGHKYNCDESPTEVQLMQTVQDLQELLDAAAETVKCSFTLEIRSK